MSAEVYDENEIVTFLKKDMKVSDWWKDLIVDWNSGKDVDLVKAKRAIPWSEVLTANTIHKKFANRLSYVSVTDTWYAWNGMIHVPCEGTSTLNKLITTYALSAIGRALDYVEEHCEKAAEAALAAGNKSQASQDQAKQIRESYSIGFKKHRAFRDRLASSAGVQAVAQCLRTACAISSRYFDNDQRWFVMRNWVLDLDDFRHGGWTLLPHSPERNVTKFFDADYNPEMNLGHWDRFMSSSLPNVGVQNYVQEVIGAGFMGTAELKAILNLLGAKDSGKSMFINTIMERCQGGAGYAVMPDSMSIIKVPGQNFGQDKFKGKRFIAISEPDENMPADTSFLKRFSGDSAMETGDKHEKSTDWVPQGVLCIASNNTLRINIRDGASVDRIKIIDFPNRFYPAGPGVDPAFEQIPELKKLLHRDSSQVLNWIIAGMMNFRAHGFILDEPAEVKLSQDKMTDNFSTAIRWINELVDEEQIVVDYESPISHCMKVRDSYAIYKFWCAEVGERPSKERTFSADLQMRYGEVKKSAGMRFPGLVPTQIFVNKWDQMMNRK